MNLLNKFIQIYKIKDLRIKIIFVLFIFAVFRLMANLPIPGVNIENLKQFFAQNQIFGLMNLFTGGALDNLSIVMLGLGPYITAVIILQLLTMIFPKFEKMYKEEGEAGKQKFNQYGRVLTVPLATLQGFGMLTLFQKQELIGHLSPELFICSILTIVCGAVFLMWLGELITEKGIGNGVSLLIFAGIIADFPNSLRQVLITWDASKIPAYIAFFVMALVVIVGVVIVNEARRNVPISYAKRVRGTKMYGGVSTYLPLNINPAGVIPIIFALSLMLFPGMIASFFANSAGIVGTIAQSVTNLLANPWIYSGMYFGLVVLFTYFYTAVTFDPKAIATNLQKMGGFIPGIRPGESTADYLYYILNRVLLFGALFLGTIAIMPSIIGGLTGIMTFQFLLGGTALLITVSVILDTVKQINAQLQMREYETF